MYKNKRNKKGDSRQHFNHTRKLAKCKRSQQEILGFVVIIMLVVIIGVIFLGISIRKGAREDIFTDDAEIANFLSVSKKYTSNCVLREPFYADLEDMIKACYNHEVCVDERHACSVVEELYSGMLNEMWPADADRPIKYYKLDIYYLADLENPSDKRMLTGLIESGDPSLCIGKRGGTSSLFKDSGSIVVELEICSG